MRDDLRLVGRFLVFLMLAFLAAASLGASVRIFLLISGIGA